MRHPISTTDHPTAAGPCAALYVESRERAIAGKRCFTVRKVLAEILGAGTVADLLLSRRPIKVTPRGGAWEIQDCTPKRLGGDVVRVLAAEAKAQKLSLSDIARVAGIHTGSAWAMFRKARAGTFENVLAIVQGLGKDLAWLGERLAEGK